MFRPPVLPLLSDEQFKRQQLIMERLAQATGFCKRKECGRPIPRQDYESQLKHDARLYCSNRCRGIDCATKAQEQRAKEQAANVKVCAQCGLPFMRHPRENHRRFETRRTCGRLCPNPAQAAQVRRSIRLTKRTHRDKGRT